MGAIKETSNKLQGMIFDIQRFSVHDGPGIRTLVFMKGCPLMCKWCSNPESQSASAEILFYEEKCIGCRECLKVCPYGESLKESWPLNLEQCRKCGKCAEVCYAEARKYVGRKISVTQALDIILRDIVFYEQSGGGVTVGGGEPLSQANFVTELLKQCKEKKIHTAVETCGYGTWNKFQKVLRFTDLLLYDIKHMDSQVHIKYTGVGNELILENAVKASKILDDIVIRFPLIPTINNSQENVHSLAKFITKSLHRVRRVDILPYHSMGASKMIRLGRKYPLDDLKPLKKKEIEDTKAILESYGLTVSIGG